LLREDLTALRRAHIAVITRSEGRRFDGLRRELARINPALQVFESVTAPVDIVPLDGSAPEPVTAWQGRAVAAFCGLGNPEAFRCTLAGAGIEVRFFEAFPDHHRYSAADLDRLRGHALPLLTTEKDAVKLEGIANAADIRSLRIAAGLPCGFYATLKQCLQRLKGPQI
jgi:tetraacyldisaccharide 4'-kinase